MMMQFLETLKTKESDLMEALQEIGRVMYANQSSSGATPNAGAASQQEQPKEKKSDENVVDADFEVVDDGSKK